MLQKIIGAMLVALALVALALVPKAGLMLVALVQKIVGADSRRNLALADAQGAELTAGR